MKARHLKKLFTQPFTYARDFGLIMGLKLFGIEMSLRFSCNKKKYEFKRHDLIEAYIHRKGYVETMIAAYRKAHMDESYQSSTAPIWVCWLQGEENMPPITKVCLNRIRRFAGNHPVHFIDIHNFNEYVEIESSIIDKYRSGNMKPAHLADLLRLKLIDKYGGIWLDSTLYLTQSVNEKLFSLPFVTIKNERVEGDYSISFYRWCSFFIGGGGDRKIISSLCAGFEEYARKEKKFMHYLIIDYMLDILCREIPDVNEYIEALPFTNPQLHELEKRFNWVYNEEDYLEMIKETSVFKLRYAVHTINEADGQPTYWSYLLHSSDL